MFALPDRRAVIARCGREISVEEFKGTAANLAVMQAVSSAMAPTLALGRALDGLASKLKK